MISSLSPSNDQCLFEKFNHTTTIKEASSPIVDPTIVKSLLKIITDLPDIQIAKSSLKYSISSLTTTDSSGTAPATDLKDNEALLNLPRAVTIQEPFPTHPPGTVTKPTTFSSSPGSSTLYNYRVLQGSRENIVNWQLYYQPKCLYMQNLPINLISLRLIPWGTLTPHLLDTDYLVRHRAFHLHHPHSTVSIWR